MNNPHLVASTSAHLRFEMSDRHAARTRFSDRGQDLCPTAQRLQRCVRVGDAARLGVQHGESMLSAETSAPACRGAPGAAETLRQVAKQGERHRDGAAAPRDHSLASVSPTRIPCSTGPVHWIQARRAGPGRAGPGRSPARLRPARRSRHGALPAVRSSPSHRRGRRAASCCDLRIPPFQSEGLVCPPRRARRRRG